MFPTRPVSRAEVIDPRVTAGAGGSTAGTTSLNARDPGLFPVEARTRAERGECRVRPHASTAPVAADVSRPHALLVVPCRNTRRSEHDDQGLHARAAPVRRDGKATARVDRRSPH